MSASDDRENLSEYPTRTEEAGKRRRFRTISTYDTADQSGFFSSLLIHTLDPVPLPFLVQRCEFVAAGEHADSAVAALELGEAGDDAVEVPGRLPAPRTVRGLGAEAVAFIVEERLLVGDPDAFGLVLVEGLLGHARFGVAVWRARRAHREQCRDRAQGSSPHRPFQGVVQSSTSIRYGRRESTRVVKTAKVAGSIIGKKSLTTGRQRYMFPFLVFAGRRERCFRLTEVIGREMSTNRFRRDFMDLVLVLTSF